MVKGDISANVSGLAAREGPCRDARDQRMLNLLRGGLPQAMVVQALTLLREVLGITCLVEEAHASEAVLMSSHERYSQRSLQARALLHSLRPLLRARLVDRKIQAVDRALSRLADREPNKISARHMFFRSSVKRD